MREADIQALISAHPECLPIAEIDQMFLGRSPIESSELYCFGFPRSRKGLVTVRKMTI